MRGLSPFRGAPREGGGSNEVAIVPKLGVVDRLADEPVQIASYDPAWPERFEEEQAALVGAIGESLTAFTTSAAPRCPVSTRSRSSTFSSASET